jgi:hypothetical protein
MKIILIICLAVSLYFILRSSTTAFTHWLGYKYRKETNIERIKEKQEKVDILVGIYKIYVTLFWGFNIKILVNILYNIPFNNIISTTIPFLIIILFFSYHILCYYFEKKYKLNSFYYDIIEYRMKQKKVTKDNDYEVIYLKTYEKHINNKKSIIPIVIGLMLYIMLL